MIRISICDEHSNLCDTLLNVLKEDSNVIQPVHTFCDLLSLEEYVEDVMSGCVDLLFINSSVNGESGIKTMNRIWEKHPQINVVFLSENPQVDVEDIFMKVHPFLPFGILNIPVNIDKFKKTIASFEQVYELRKSVSITIKPRYSNEIIRLDTTKIRYIESEKRLLYIYIINGMQFDCYMKLDEIESALPTNFIRTHRSFEVNMDFVDSFAEDFIRIRDRKQNVLIPVSRAEKSIVKEKLKNYFGYNKGSE